MNFTAREVKSLLRLAGIEADLPTLNLMPPMGIRFYTFQSMGYTNDVYLGRL